MRRGIQPKAGERLGRPRRPGARGMGGAPVQRESGVDGVGIEVRVARGELRAIQDGAEAELEPARDRVRDVPGGEDEETALGITDEPRLDEVPNPVGEDLDFHPEGRRRLPFHPAGDVPRALRIQIREPLEDVTAPHVDEVPGQLLEGGRPETPCHRRPEVHVRSSATRHAHGRREVGTPAIVPREAGASAQYGSPETPRVLGEERELPVGRPLLDQLVRRPDRTARDLEADVDGVSAQDGGIPRRTLREAFPLGVGAAIGDRSISAGASEQVLVFLEKEAAVPRSGTERSSRLHRPRESRVVVEAGERAAHRPALPLAKVRGGREDIPGVGRLEPKAGPEIPDAGERARASIGEPRDPVFLAPAARDSVPETASAARRRLRLATSGAARQGARIDLEARGGQLRDDVHDAAQSVGAVERRKGTLHDLDALHARQRHAAQVAVLEQRAGARLAVEQDEDARAANAPDHEIRADRRGGRHLDAGKLRKQPVGGSDAGRFDRLGLHRLDRHGDLRAESGE